MIVLQKKRNDKNKRINSFSHSDAKRSLKTFSIASLLNDMGADAVKPFWPSFVTGVLGAPVSVLGLLDGIGDAVSYASRWPAGWLADRFHKRKPLIWLGYFFAGLSRIGYAIAPAISWLFPFKVMDRLGKMRDPPRDALLADVTPAAKRGRAFGVLTAMDNVGAAVGPLLGLLLISMLSWLLLDTFSFDLPRPEVKLVYALLFALAGIPSLISAFLVLTRVHEHRPKGLHFYALKKKLGKPFWRFVAINAFFALGWISLSFLVLSATAEGRVSLVFTPLLFVAMSAAAVISSVFAGKLADRRGTKPLLVFGAVLFPLTMAGSLLFESTQPTGAAAWGGAFLLFALYGAHYGAYTALQPTYVTQLLPRQVRAYGGGVSQALFGFSTLIASTTAGLLWHYFNPETAFFTAALVTLAATIGMMVWLKD